MRHEVLRVRLGLKQVGFAPVIFFSFLIMSNFNRKQMFSTFELRKVPGKSCAAPIFVKIGAETVEYGTKRCFLKEILLKKSRTKSFFVCEKVNFNQQTAEEFTGMGHLAVKSQGFCKK